MDESCGPARALAGRAPTLAPLAHKPTGTTIGSAKPDNPCATKPDRSICCQQAIEANERSAARIDAYRKLETRLGETRTAAREATEGDAKLGAAMRKTAAPSKAMQKELGQVRREARRLTDSVTKQTRALDQQRVVLRRAKEDVRDLARRERELGTVLDDQRRRRDRLADSLARQQAARQQRDAMRGRLIDAVAIGYPLVRGITPPSARQSASSR